MNPSLRTYRFEIKAQYAPLTSVLPNSTSIYHKWPPIKQKRKLPLYMLVAAISNPSGCAPDSLIGPPIHVQSGDKLEVILSNQLESSGLSLHWHGFEMKNALQYDGVVGLTQNPVGPNHQFVYNFTVNETAGTYWYHTHSGALGADIYNSIKGPLIVHPKGKEMRQMIDTLNRINYFIQDEDNSTKLVPNSILYKGRNLSPLAYENERILFFSDGFLMSESLAYMNVMGGLNAPPSKNDKGWLVGTHPWEFGTCNGKLREVIHVSPGETYKFRLLSASSMYAFRVKIHNLPMIVVGADSDPVEPYEVTHLIIHAAERFDVMVTIPAIYSLGETFWIKADTLESQMQGYQNGVRAILHIADSTNSLGVNISDAEIPDPKDDITIQKGVEEVPTMNCYDHTVLNSEKWCLPLTKLTSKKSRTMKSIEADIETHTVDFHFQPSPQFSHFVRIDEGEWIQHVNPFKSMLHSNFDPSVDQHPHTAMLHVKDYSEVIVVWRNKSTMDHPIHVHGYKMEIIEIVLPVKEKDCSLVSCRLADEYTSADYLSKVCNRPQFRPVIKDTFILPAGGTVITRFETYEPAVWFAHCHLDLHKDDGMSMILNVGNYKPAKDNKWLPEDYPPHDSLYLQSKSMHYPACKCFINEDATLDRKLTLEHKCSRDHLCHHKLSQVANLQTYFYLPGIGLAGNDDIEGWHISVIFTAVIVFTALVIIYLPKIKSRWRKSDNYDISSDSIEVESDNESIVNLSQINESETSQTNRMNSTVARRVTRYTMALNKASTQIFKEDTFGLTGLKSKSSFDVDARSSHWKQIKELLSEDWEQIRPSSINILRLVEVLGLSLLTGLIFFDVINDVNGTGLGESISLLFFSMTLWTFNRMYPAIPSYNKWQRVALISAKDKHYSLFSLWVARTTAFVLAECWWPLLYSLICLPMAGFTNKFHSIFTIGLLLSLNTICYIALGSLIGTIIKSVPVGMIASTILSQISMICAGFYTTLPEGIAFLRFLSPVYYTFVGIIKTTFKWTDTFTCINGDSQVGPSQCFIEYSPVFDRFKQRGLNVATYNDPSAQKIFLEVICLVLFYSVAQILIYLFLLVQNRRQRSFLMS